MDDKFVPIKPGIQLRAVVGSGPGPHTVAFGRWIEPVIRRGRLLYHAGCTFPCDGGLGTVQELFAHMEECHGVVALVEGDPVLGELQRQAQHYYGNGCLVAQPGPFGSWEIPYDYDPRTLAYRYAMLMLYSDGCWYVTLDGLTPRLDGGPITSDDFLQLRLYMLGMQPLAPMVPAGNHPTSVKIELYSRRWWLVRQGGAIFVTHPEGALTPDGVVCGDPVAVVSNLLRYHAA